MMNETVKRFLAIVGGCVVLACGLGLGLDLITANVAVEYFSVHHPKIVETDNPWILAVVWGIAASWWFGALGGLILAVVNQRRRQPLPPRRILRWVAIACLVLWAIMIVILIAVLVIASTIPLAERPATFDHDRRLMAVAMAHQFEYLWGGIALVILAVMTWISRD